MSKYERCPLQNTSCLATQSVLEENSIDERVQPNLAATSLDVQQKEVFCSFLLASFPAQFASCGARVDVNWVDYARQSPLGAPAVLVWSFRSLATLFMGRQYQDTNMIVCSRHMYTHVLSCLGGLVSSSRFSRADEALAASILLTMYELLNGTNPTSWVVHSKGVARMIQIRGPEAHRSGFGLTLLKSARAFLVAGAFMLGEKCFLSDPPWHKFLQEVADLETKSAKGSQLGLAVDRSFIEITFCPGWLVEVRNLVFHDSINLPARRNLAHDIIKARDALHAFLDQLQLSLAAGTSTQNHIAFIGPIDWRFADSFTKLSSEGIRTAIVLLNHLLELIDTKLHDRHDRMLLLIEMGLMRSRYFGEYYQAPSGSKIFWNGYQEIQKDPGLDRLDRFALSMGLIGFTLR